VRSLTRFLSTTFDEPRGTQVAADGVRGYYIDMRVKADEPDPAKAWPFVLRKEAWVAFAQMGLGAYERFLAGEGEQWLAVARHVGDTLLEHQTTDGARRGAWEHDFDFPHTLPLRAPWISAMAQGEGASLLVRLYLETGEERYADAARLALGPMALPSEEGGASALLGGRPFPEEYPTSPPSFVLNGGIFSIWGLYDVGRGLGDAGAEAAFEEAVDTLAANVQRWDTGWWSSYDLYPHKMRNVAAFGYHQLHIDQLRATAAIAPRAELTAAADRFERYGESGVNRARAFAAKAAFRLRVPRNRLAKEISR
jgi:heparosan-N-sulfate-glucuronate 5-epimerase